MKERKRRGIVLLRESRFSESVSGGSGEFAIAVVVQHFLEVCASAREAIEISIAFAQRKISVRPAGQARIIIEIFLIFWDRQIVKFAREKRVRVIELAAVRRFVVARWRSFGKVFRWRARRCCGWFLRWNKGRGRRVLLPPRQGPLRGSLRRGVWRAWKE